VADIVNFLNQSCCDDRDKDPIDKTKTDTRKLSQDYFEAGRKLET